MLVLVAHSSYCAVHRSDELPPNGCRELRSASSSRSSLTRSSGRLMHAQTVICSCRQPRHLRSWTGLGLVGRSSSRMTGELRLCRPNLTADPQRPPSHTSSTFRLPSMEVHPGPVRCRACLPLSRFPRPRPPWACLAGALPSARPQTLGQARTALVSSSGSANPSRSPTRS